MSGKDPHDWLRKSTPFSRLINPELHAKPNLTVGAIGTGIFVFVIANLAYQKYSYEPPRVVRHLGELVQENYGRPGLSHIFVAGANDDGMKEIEVWMATYAPGSGTPIHRHNCEEVFIVLMGGGTLFLAPASNASFPGRPQMFAIYPNSTFIIPVDSVHQVRNTMGSEDLQVVIVISRPPMKAYVYKDWTTTHDEAVYHFPYFEKKLPATSHPISETDSAISITSRMDDLQELVIDVDQTYSNELR